MVLYCPPWRKPRPTSPSEIARFYQGIPSCETQVQQQQEQGTWLDADLDEITLHDVLWKDFQAYHMQTLDPSS